MINYTYLNDGSIYYNTVGYFYSEMALRCLMQTTELTQPSFIIMNPIQYSQLDHSPILQI